MKTLKLSLVLLLSLSVFAACSSKTEDAIDPDSGVAIAGTYTITTLRYDDGTTATVQPGYTKKIHIVRLTETTVDMSIDLSEPGKPTETLRSSDALDLERSGQTINLLAPDGTKVGSYSGGTLKVRITQNGQAATFEGKK